ncbi:unnamed protein product [Diplocarpon coronariae]
MSMSMPRPRPKPKPKPMPMPMPAPAGHANARPEIPTPRDGEASAPAAVSSRVPSLPAGKPIRWGEGRGGGSPSDGIMLMIMKSEGKGSVVWMGWAGPGRGDGMQRKKGGKRSTTPHNIQSREKAISCMQHQPTISDLRCCCIAAALPLHCLGVPFSSPESQSRPETDQPRTRRSEEVLLRDGFEDSSPALFSNWHEGFCRAYPVPRGRTDIVTSADKEPARAVGPSLASSPSVRGPGRATPTALPRRRTFSAGWPGVASRPRIERAPQSREGPLTDRGPSSRDVGARGSSPVTARDTSSPTSPGPDVCCGDDAASSGQRLDGPLGRAGTAPAPRRATPCSATYACFQIPILPGPDAKRETRNARRPGQSASPAGASAWEPGNHPAELASRHVLQDRLLACHLSSPTHGRAHARELRRPKLRRAPLTLPGRASGLRRLCPARAHPPRRTIGPAPCRGSGAGRAGDGQRRAGPPPAGSKQTVLAPEPPSPPRVDATSQPDVGIDLSGHALPGPRATSARPSYSCSAVLPGQGLIWTDTDWTRDTEHGLASTSQTRRTLWTPSSVRTLGRNRNLSRSYGPPEDRHPCETCAGTWLSGTVCGTGRDAVRCPTAALRRLFGQAVSRVV